VKRVRNAVIGTWIGSVLVVVHARDSYVNVERNQTHITKMGSG
jgi:hypothetical protein